MIDVIGNEPFKRRGHFVVVSPCVTAMSGDEAREMARSFAESQPDEIQDGLDDIERMLSRLPNVGETNAAVGSVELLVALAALVHGRRLEGGFNAYRRRR